MPRKGENIRKRKDGRWEARYEKCRDQNGRIQYGYLYGRTYEAVKKKNLSYIKKFNRKKLHFWSKVVHFSCLDSDSVQCYH